MEKHLQMCFAKESTVQDFKIKAQKPNRTMRMSSGMTGVSPLHDAL